MKLSLLLLAICAILGSAAAIAPNRLRGSAHSFATRRAPKRQGIKYRQSYGKYSSSSYGYRNRTSHSIQQHHEANLKSHSNHSSVSLVASHPARATSTKLRYWRKGLSPSTPGNSGLTMSKTTYPDISSVSRDSRAVSGVAISRAKVSPGTKTVKRSPLNMNPTPAPTAGGSPDTTVFIEDENEFALLLPNRPGELISDAEADGVAFCTSGSCPRPFPEGFITAAAVSRASDGSWIQVTGCIDPSKSSLSSSDDGGQFDVRFPNGAQCTFGGYGASFIEQVEPSANRFCLRCCAEENDQINCNSHQDRAGCPVAIPGTYDFPDKGVYCS